MERSQNTFIVRVIVQRLLITPVNYANMRAVFPKARRHFLFVQVGWYIKQQRNHLSRLASHCNGTVGAVVIVRKASELRIVAVYASLVAVFLTGAPIPQVSLLIYVDLAARVHISERRYRWGRILLVRNPSEPNFGRWRVDVIRKGWVPNAGQAGEIRFESPVLRQMQWQVHRLQKPDGSAEGVTDYCDRGRVVLLTTGDDRRQYIVRRRCVGVHKALMDQNGRGQAREPLRIQGALHDVSVSQAGDDF